MTCTPVQLPGGARAIVCTGGRRRARCASCAKPADLLCDWKVAGHPSGRCDAPLCPACTFSPAADNDLCPAHRAAWLARFPQDREQ